MTAVVRTLLNEWAVPRMGVRRVRVETYVGNIGSRRVFEKLGFIYETTTPMHKVMNSGRLVEGMDVLCWTAPE